MRVALHVKRYTRASRLQLLRDGEPVLFGQVTFSTTSRWSELEASIK